MPEALAFARSRQLPVFILGGGSNVLISDDGFPGLVVRIAIGGVSHRLEGGLISVTGGAGEDWDRFVERAVEGGWAGLECLSGIPGLLGGTPVQNVGAYGQEVSETITAVRVYDRQTESLVDLSAPDCRFGYRSSLFNRFAPNRYIVLAVTFALRPQGEPAIRYPDLKSYFAHAAAGPSLKEVREAVLAIRARKAMVLQPGDPDCRSAGSFFKNPVVAGELLARIEEAAGESVPRFPADDGQVKLPAAWLIERAGFRRGHSRGRAGISSKHTLAIVNRGGATAVEVLDLAHEIQETVRERFGLLLQMEPVLVGFERDQIGKTVD